MKSLKINRPFYTTQSARAAPIGPVARKKIYVSNSNKNRQATVKYQSFVTSRIRRAQKRFAKNLNHRVTRNAVLRSIFARVPPLAGASG
jgi:hypothetical protein